MVAIAILLGAAAAAAAAPRVDYGAIVALPNGKAVIVGPQLLLTAKHVVRENQFILWQLGAIARVICRDTDADLAIVHAALPEGTPWIPITRRRPRVGEPIYVPDRDNAGAWTLQSTSIRTLRQVRDPSRNFNAEAIIFADPIVYKGLSGTPILDNEGHVIGVVTLGYGDQGEGGGSPLSSLDAGCGRVLDRFTSGP